MLETFIADVERRRKRLTVYSDESDPDIVSQLAIRNVSVRRRRLPSPGPEPFVTVHENGSFVGAITLADLEWLLAPPVPRPGNREGLSEGYRVLLEVLEETVFSALNRRQLLGASREIEDRAFRVGEGTLRVSVQSLSVLQPQLGVYRQLGGETDLDIHVYGEADWSPPPIENVTYHPDTHELLGRFWCLAFDGGGDDAQVCALLAREDEEGYSGFWSYDPALVKEILRVLGSVGE